MPEKVPSCGIVAKDLLLSTYGQEGNQTFRSLYRELLQIDLEVAVFYFIGQFTNIFCLEQKLQLFAD